MLSWVLNNCFIFHGIFNIYSEDDGGLISNSSDLSYSHDLVHETKRRLRSLEAEAEVNCNI